MERGSAQRVQTGCLTVVALLWLTVSATAQPAEQPTTLDGLRQAAIENRHESALAAAEQLLSGSPEPAVARLAGLLGGRAAWGLGRRSDAARLLTPAVQSWPHDSDWGDGVAAYVELLGEQGYLFRAAQWAVALAAVNPGRAARLLTELPQGAFSLAELHYLGWQASTAAEPDCAILTELARRAPRDSELMVELVGAALEGCGSQAMVAGELAELAPGARPAPIGFYDIAVIAPLNGRYARFGESLAQGAVLAVEEANAGAPMPLRIRVFDSWSDPLTAARQAGRAVQLGVGAMFGDLLTPATIAVAGAAEAGMVPLVSPAATRADVGTIGNHVFQTIVPREIQAEALARAAVDRLGLMRLAVLYPEHADGQSLATRFARTASRLGAELVAMTPYPAGQTNFALELEPLADLLPEAVFIPGAPRELMAVVPQFSYYEVDTRVLAIEELGLTEVLQATSDYLQAAIFTDSYYRVPAVRRGDFSSRYNARYGRDPDPYATRGYVAMGVLAAAMQSGARNRYELTSALERRVVRFTPDDVRGILLLNELEGRVALFQADGTRVSPLD